MAKKRKTGGKRPKTSAKRSAKASAKPRRTAKAKARRKAPKRAKSAKGGGGLFGAIREAASLRSRLSGRNTFED